MGGVWGVIDNGSARLGGRMYVSGAGQELAFEMLAIAEYGRTVFMRRGMFVSVLDVSACGCTG